jgi:hypothetical protein
MEIPEWLIALLIALLGVALLTILVLLLSKKRIEPQQPPSQEDDTTPPPLTKSEREDIKAIDILKVITREVKKQSAPLADPKDYWDAFISIRSKRIHLDRLNAELDLQDSIEEAIKNLSQRENETKKRIEEKQKKYLSKQKENVKDDQSKATQ